MLKPPPPGHGIPINTIGGPGEKTMKLTAKYAAAICVALPALLGSVVAQQGISRTPLQTVEFPSGYETVTGIAQIPANTCVARHTHPGIETSYMMDGDLVLKIEGKPDLRLKAGDSFQIPAGVPHEGCASNAAKILTVHVIEKGKPLATPAPRVGG
jgi:quercetin dioxygenase-like cupin family protein